MKKKYCFLLLILSISICHSQERSNFGFGASAGFKMPMGEGGFMAEVKVKKVIDFYAGFGGGKYAGYGFALGTEVFFLKKDLQPCLGIAYNYLSGNKFYIGENENRTDFRVKASNNFIGTIGVRWIIHFDEKSANGFMAITPYLSYRYLYAENRVLYEGGVENKSAERRINNRIGDGLGFGLKVLYFIDKRTRN